MSAHGEAAPLPAHAACITLYDFRRNRLRWTILALISAMSFITFRDKAVISREFHIDKAHMSTIFSAFVLASAIGQIPAGWLTDRIGPRRTPTGCASLWSLATLLTAADGFAGWRPFASSPACSRAAPSPAARALVPWFGRTERGFVHGAPHLFGRFATALVPLISVSVGAVWGRRGVFYVFGALGLLWALGFWVIYRDRPEDHPAVTQTELALALDGAPSVVGQRGPTPWRALFASPTSWGLIIGWAAYTYCIGGPCRATSRARSPPWCSGSWRKVGTGPCRSSSPPRS